MLIFSPSGGIRTRRVFPPDLRHPCPIFCRTCLSQWGWRGLQAALPGGSIPIEIGPDVM